MELIAKLFITAGFMGVLDYLWLGLIANKLYRSEMGKLLLDKPNLAPALLFYAIYVIGLVVFVISPACSKGSLAYAAGYGALFGLVAYATYDLTNLAVMKGISTKIVIIDLIWGVVLTTVVSVLTFLVVSKWIS